MYVKSEGLKLNTANEDENINRFYLSVEEELFNNIVPFWIKYVPDNENGGFYGRITNDLIIEKRAFKSLILNARILLTFSILYQFRREPRFLQMADRAYQYLMRYFYDGKYGGMYWLVNFKGEVIDNKKKIYGQAFTIYAMAEYFRASGLDEALQNACGLFELIEKYNYDKNNRGYFETSNRDWTIAGDMRLSELDMNEMKSMNTHLHLLEAYTALQRVCRESALVDKLRELLRDFIDFIIDPETMHFKMFFDEYWRPKSKSVSFGHDIEGSWLLCEAVNLIADKTLEKQVKEIALKMVEATIMDGFGERKAIYAEKDGEGTLFHEVHWWQQAEAVVGFINAYQLSGKKRYLNWARDAWAFVTNHFVDREHGEWFYEIDGTGAPVAGRYKVSEWKGPYHNGRACLEVLKRMKNKCQVKE